MWKESVPEDFVSREEFINRTGIFISPSQFGYIYDIEFKESGKTVDSFIQDYEKDYSGIIELPLKGIFKYIVDDESVATLGEYKDIYDPNIWEIANNMVRSEAQIREEKYKLYDKYMEQYDKCMELLKNMQKAYREATDVANIYHNYMNDISEIINRYQLFNAVPATNIPS